MAEITVTSTSDKQADVDAAAKAVVSKEGTLEVPSEEKPEEKPTEGEKPEKTEEAEKTTEMKPEEKPEEKEGEKPPEEKPKKKGGFQERIDKLTERNYRLQAELEQLRAAQAKPPTPPPTAKPKPKQEDFKEYDEYVEALADWKAEQKFAEEKVKSAQEAQEAELRETFETYNKRLAVARTKHEDFDEVVGREDLQIPKAVQLAIISLENGPEVAYHLGQNTELCEKLAEMSDIEAVMEIGRLSASLKPPEQPKPAAGEKKPPAPIKPVGAASTKSTRPLDEVDYQEFRRRREAGEG